MTFQSLGSKDEAFFVGDTETDLVAELVFLVCLAFANTSRMGFMQTVKFVCIISLLNQKTVSLGQFRFQALWHRFRFAFDVTNNPAQIGLQALDLFGHPFHLSGMGIATGLQHGLWPFTLITLSQDNALLLCQANQALSAAVEQFGVGWMGHGFGLNSGIHADPF